MSFNVLPFFIICILVLLKSSFTKERLAKLKPSDATMGCIGCYVILTIILDYVSGFSYWYLLQFITALSLIGYAMDSKKAIPSWKIGRRWLVSVIFCLPVHVLWSWSGLIQFPCTFSLALSVIHLTVTLCVLPLYISVRVISIVLLVILYAIYRSDVDLALSESGSFLISLLGLSVMIFFIIVYNKRELAWYTCHGYYLNNQIKDQQIKKQARQAGFGLYADPNMVRNNSKEAHAFIDYIMKEVTQLISYLENRELYKENLDLITKNFVIWDIFLKERTGCRSQIFIPVEVSLDELVRQLEVALALQSKEHVMPKLLIEPKDNKLPEKIICNVHQIICLLTPIVLSILSLHDEQDSLVRIQLYTTYLKYEPRDASQETCTTGACFPAIALLISHAIIPEESLPKLNSSYEAVTAGSEFSWHSVVQERSEWATTNIEKRTIEQIVRTHYGYLQFPASHKKPMLIVLPFNAAAVRDEMISRILPSGPSISYREFKSSIKTLTQAYNNLCTIADMRTIVLDELFLLVRRCYGFRRHVSGKLCYVRALGIAQLVAEWVPYQPRPVYFSVLYGVVRYAGLPLSYVRANYSMEAYSFVESIMAIKTHQEMEPYGLYVGNRLKRIINREQFFILCIKFAERLYDLRCAKDYIHLEKEKVKYMAQEALTVDVELGKKYLHAQIVEELVEAAQQALEVCEGTC